MTVNDDTYCELLQELPDDPHQGTLQLIALAHSGTSQRFYELACGHWKSSIGLLFLECTSGPFLMFVTLIADLNVILLLRL